MTIQWKREEVFSARFGSYRLMVIQRTEDDCCWRVSKDGRQIDEGRSESLEEAQSEAIDTCVLDVASPPKTVLDHLIEDSL